MEHQERSNFSKLSEKSYTSFEQDSESLSEGKIFYGFGC